MDDQLLPRGVRITLPTATIADELIEYVRLDQRLTGARLVASDRDHATHVTRSSFDAVRAVEEALRDRLSTVRNEADAAVIQAAALRKDVQALTAARDALVAERDGALAQRNRVLAKNRELIAEIRDLRARPRR